MFLKPRDYFKRKKKLPNVLMFQPEVQLKVQTKVVKYPSEWVSIKTILNKTKNTTQIANLLISIRVNQNYKYKKV